MFTEEEVQEKSGVFSRMFGRIIRRDVEEEVEETPQAEEAPVARRFAMAGAYKYHVTIRRHIASFDDALAAATSFKRGEQQVLNLTGTEPLLRQKIVDFMSGVNFAQEGSWEELGENIYLVAPAHAFVEVAPSTPRANIAWN